MSATFQWPVRVYYEDTDAGGIVFYANYLKFFERARTEWLRSGGIDQSVLAATHDVLFVVVHTAVDYHASAVLDDELTISVLVEKAGRASVQFVQKAWRSQKPESSPACNEQAKVTPIDRPESENKLLATGQITIACVNRLTMRACPIPAPVMDLIRRHDTAT